MSSIDKTLSWSRHGARSPTHQRAIKEESQDANHDGVVHQAFSMLQYINVIANLFIMENSFTDL